MARRTRRWARAGERGQRQWIWGEEDTVYEDVIEQRRWHDLGAYANEHGVASLKIWETEDGTGARGRRLCPFASPTDDSRLSLQDWCSTRGSAQ